jgi:cob(I)alamin adenosyltransferase
MKNGFTHIYTGEGKGKTTSAVGLGVRALGHNLKVCYAYFHKRPEKYGYTEIQALETLGASIYGFAKGHPFCDKNLDTDLLKKEAREGITFLTELIRKEPIDMLIMDEVIISVRDNYLPEQQLIDFINGKPLQLELILTGRGASTELMKHADYVSYVTKMKHPYDKGISSRKGIEY